MTRTLRSLFASSGKAAPVARSQSLFEALEGRDMMTVVIATPIPDATTQRGAGAVTIDLSNRYTDPAVTNVVRLVTNSGNLDMAMFGNAAANTVANFLAYLNAGSYNNTIFHRTTRTTADPNGTNTADGIGVLQGGGFTRPTATYSSTPPTAAMTPQAIATNAAINLENATGNVRGTIAMARTQQPNTATSQFFFNTVSNPVLNATGPGTGYAVFGQVLPGSLSVLDALYAFTRTDFSQDFGGSFGSLPLRTEPTSPNFVPLPIAPSAYLTITSGSTLTGVFSQLSVTSSNNSLATASIVNNQLVVTPVAGAIGTVSITVRATGFDNSVVEDTFDLEITSAVPSASTLQGRDNWAIGRNMPVYAVGVRDTDSAITRVDFFRDTNGNGLYDSGTDLQIGTDSTGADGYFASVDTSTFTAGTNTILARILDSDGAATVISQTVNMIVRPASTTATPTQGTVNPGGGYAIDISGVAPAANNVRRVSIFLDSNTNSTFDAFTDRLLGTATFNAGTGNWVFEGTSSQLTTGANRLFVRVADIFGNLGAAQAVNITLA